MNVLHSLREEKHSNGSQTDLPELLSLRIKIDEITNKLLLSISNDPNSVHYVKEIPKF